MPRKIFFSFAYDDVINFRVNVVRNNWLLKHPDDTFVDGSIWEKAKTRGESYIKDLIEEGLRGTSVTVVLIGEKTADRRWIKYEIVKSFKRGNGILAVHINRIRGKDGYIAPRGKNPLKRLRMDISDDGSYVEFAELINNTWYEYDDIPRIRNKESNTVFFEDGFFDSDFGASYLFSEKFNTYCWLNDDGNRNFVDWIEEAAEYAGR